MSQNYSIEDLIYNIQELSHNVLLTHLRDYARERNLLELAQECHKYFRTFEDDPKQTKREMRCYLTDEHKQAITNKIQKKDCYINCLSIVFINVWNTQEYGDSYTIIPAEEESRKAVIENINFLIDGVRHYWQKFALDNEDFIGRYERETGQNVGPIVPEEENPILLKMGSLPKYIGFSVYYVDEKENNILIK